MLFWIPRLLNAVEIPNLKSHSAEARRQAEDAINVVIEGLRSGHNHILWPAGHVWHVNRECLGAARTLAEVLAAVPDANVVAVRTRGLWGSMFSYAPTGQGPHLIRTLLKGLGLLLANLLFLAPRREVEITVELLDPAIIPPRTREQLNPFFEAWYNAPGPENPSFVPYHFLFGRRSYVFPTLREDEESDLAAIKPETRRQVAQMIAEKLHRDPLPSDEEPKTRLEELGLDSLDRMELSLEIERRFGFTGARVPDTVGDLFSLAGGQQQLAAPAPPPPQWYDPRPADLSPTVLADTIPEAFVRRAITSGAQVAAADSISGILTYRRMLVGALLLAEELARVPSSNIGLMLPAGIAMDLLFFAAHLAGKLPVLLNWTTGPASLRHAAELTGLTHVITSRRFIDRTNVMVEGTQYLFIEDMRARIGKLRQLSTLLRVACLPKQVLRRTPRPDPASPAVVLFTSGSEKAPKAVPLAHRNLLSNIRAVLEAFELRSADILVGFLPPFHSFGLTATALLPVLSGVRVVYHPDPTDAAAIARKIGSYQATVICGTPTFLSYVLERAKPQELHTIRLAVSGAEKCPEALFDRFAEAIPGFQLLEGYGITECAPVVCANRPGRSKRGSLGLPLPGVEVRVADVDRQTPVPPGQMGMLWVAGPNVFPGYLGPDAPHPFVDHDGRRWYVTGDLGKIDADGFIWFLGRLKRFLKAGGEMISLPAIEEPLARSYPPTEEGPRVAVEGVESDDGRRIVLFTTESLSLREANEILHAGGLRGIMRLDEVRQVEKIPVLGTGKTDYKVLRQWIEVPGE